MMGNVLLCSVIRKIVNRKYQKIDAMMRLSINENNRKNAATKKNYNANCIGWNCPEMNKSKAINILKLSFYFYSQMHFHMNVI